MHISRTDLNLFVVFEAIYSQGGVTRAAEVLNLSQSTISHALGRLRDRVDDPLFVRQGQRLTPTPLAQTMIGPVREALKLFERTLGQLDRFDPANAAARFNIGMRTLMEATHFLPLALRVAQAAPGITLFSAPFERRRLEQALASGELSMAIDVFQPLSPEVQRVHLGGAKLVVAARRGHPLIDGALDLETYLRAEHVVVTSRPEGLGPDDMALARDGRRRRIRARCQQIGTAMRIVAASDFLLTMSESFAREATLRAEVQILPAPFEAPPVDTYLYWHINMDSDPANRWCRGMIRDLAAERAARRG